MKKIEQEIKTYLEERNWTTMKPGDLAKSISIESAELLELFQWTNPTQEEVLRDPKLLAQLRKELADVLIYCLNITVLLGIDTETMIMEKLELVKKKYPAEQVRNDTDSESKAQHAYLAIKKQHREQGIN